MSRKPIVRLQESFKLFVDKFNILSNNVGDPSQLNTYQDSDLVTVLNEIEAAFDASAGEIIYPNGQDGETSTHLKISTNQHGGQDIDIDAGRDFLVDAVRNINLTGVSFDGDYSGNYVSKVDGTSLDSVGGAITVTGNSTYDLTTGGNFTQNTTGNIILDATGDITLDAAGNDIIFKNGGGNDTVTHSLANNAHYTVTTPSNYTVDVNGDITFDAEGNDIIFKNGDGNDQVSHTLADGAGYTVTTPGSYTLDAVGDIALDAGTGMFRLRRGSNLNHLDSVQIEYNSSGNFTVDVPNDMEMRSRNDIILDVASAGTGVLKFQDDNADVWQYLTAGNLTYQTGYKDQRINLLGYRHHRVADSSHDSVGGPISIIGNSTYDLTTGGDVTLDVGGDYDLTTDTTYDLTTGGNFTQTTTGHIDLNATENIVLDAAGDIYLNAGDSDIIFQRNNDTFGHWKMGITGSPNTFALATPKGNFHVDAANDIVLDAGDSDIIFKRNGTTFARWQMGMSGDATLTRQYYSQGGLELDASGNITLDASGDIIFDADGTDLIFKNGDDGDQASHTLNTHSNYILTTPNHYKVDAVGDIILDADGNHFIFRNGDGNDSAQITFLDGGGFTLNTPEHLTLKAAEDITLNANGGDIFLKDGGDQYGCLRATISNDLIIKSGTTTAMTFSGANVTMGGTITLPSSDLDTTEKTVHGAINEVDSDLGERTSLSSFYDGHKGDIVTALNRVAARVINIYDESGNLLNP